MHLILFDTETGRENLKPFTFTRPIANIRVGILTIQEKWEHYFKKVFPLTAPYLAGKFPAEFDKKNLYINTQCLPNKKLVKKLKKIKKGESLYLQGELVAVCTDKAFENTASVLDFAQSEVIIRKEESLEASWLTDRAQIFKQNRAQIIEDFQLITANRQSEEITDPHTIVYGEENIFIEKGAKIRCAILNATDAPIYIGKDTEVHEGAIIKGAFALCEGAHVNMGAKIKGDTTIGPYCKVGGEISNSVLFGYSNKGHDGFLGNSVLGEWCNLGADTNTSNLKNNYGLVDAWDYATESSLPTGEQFYGLMMGDHSKAGINTMFNTGTVVGLSANIFGGDFPPKFVPSFSWGNKELATFRIEKAFEVATRMMERRKITFTEEDKSIFEFVMNTTNSFRK